MTNAPQAKVRSPEAERSWRAFAPAGGRATVFVAEDDPEFRHALGEVLSVEGFRPVLFPTAQKLLSALDDQLPDAIVTDLVMPGLSGAQLLRVLRENDRWRLLPVIVMTGSNDTALPLRLDAPIVYKPDTEALVGMIRMLLEQRPQPAAA